MSNFDNFRIPADEETKEQRQFREDMEKAGFQTRWYSGRGMFGRSTYGVTCRGGVTCNSDEDLPDVQDVYRATKVRLARDSMGTGTILYVHVV
jgi:hypothetical protein